MQRRVVGKKPSLDAGVERGAQDTVNPANRADAEWPAAHPDGEVRVEVVEVVRAEVEQFDSSEVGVEVPVDDFSVQLAGRGLEPVAAFQPPPQVLACGHVVHSHVDQQELADLGKGFASCPFG